MKNMTSKNLLVFLVSAFVLAALSASNVSAFGSISSIEIDDLEVLGSSIDLANFAGQTVPIRVVFKATADAEDVRVKAWISGESDNIYTSRRIDVLSGRTYTETVLLDMPSSLDELDENRKLNVMVESKQDGTADLEAIEFTVQRESYTMEILSVDMDAEVKAGEALTIDVVLKNRGRQLAEDTFVTVSVPELGLESRAYYGDLSAQDESNPDRDDAVEKRAYLKVPSDTTAGLYTVLIEAFNDDSIVRTEKRVYVTGAEDDTKVVFPTTSKTFAAGAKGTYTVTIVNKGNEIRVFDLSVDAPAGLNVDVSESVVVVPAGSSRTVTMDATSSKEGMYAFTVNVNSDSELIDTKTMTASVEGKDRIAIGGNSTVLLTVVLAIIFIVLLVVLIVLLTRKPETTEESESYY